MAPKLNRRQSERAYPKNLIEILVNDKSYCLNDISREGFGVRVDDSHAFFIGQRIASIFLERNAEALLLKGIVSHMTQNNDGIVCGIRFEYSDSHELYYVEQIKLAFLDKGCFEKQ